MANYIPGINTTGLFTLLPPFDNALLPDVPYTCIGIRRLTDIAAAGGDPQAEYYTPYAIAEADYEADVANEVCIITLQSGSSSIVYVPSRYIDKAPELGGVQYTAMLMAIELGPVRDNLDLTYLKTKVAGVIEETIGITATPKLVAASLPMVLTNAQDETLEAARQANIAAVQTDHAKYLKAAAERDEAYAKIAELDAWIVARIAADNAPPP